MGAEDESEILGHFSDTLDEMAQTIADLEDSYFLALREVMCRTDRALRDISRIDSNYISCVVTVMASWQEVVQATVSHMENVDTTIYLACHEDTWRVMKEYVAEVIRARKECNAAHTKENEAQKQTIRSSDTEDPVIRLLDATCQAVRLQAKRAVDAFLNKIKETLHRHVPIITQGSLIANALSTCMQFQMSIWRMIGDECICPLRVKHSDWCRLAGIIQAIVEMFPNNCAIIFPQLRVGLNPLSRTI